jgi:hypothetical protein
MAEYVLPQKTTELLDDICRSLKDNLAHFAEHRLNIENSLKK